MRKAVRYLQGKRECLIKSNAPHIYPQYVVISVVCLSWEGGPFVGQLKGFWINWACEGILRLWYIVEIYVSLVAAFGEHSWYISAASKRESYPSAFRLYVGSKLQVHVSGIGGFLTSLFAPYCEIERIQIRLVLNTSDMWVIPVDHQFPLFIV